MQETSRPVGHTVDAQKALAIGRSTLYRLMREDPDFPRPFTIGGQLTWYLDELEAYKASRPRRQYAAGVAAQ